MSHLDSPTKREQRRWLNVWIKEEILSTFNANISMENAAGFRVDIWDAGERDFQHMGGKRNNQNNLLHVEEETGAHDRAYYNKSSTCSR